MVIAIQKLFAQLLFWLYELLDTIFEMFAVLCGIEMVETTDADAPRSLIEIFLESSAVTRAFLLIVVVDGACYDCRHIYVKYCLAAGL